MKNVTVTWDLPTTLVDGDALSASEIRHVQVDMSADAGENWSEIDIIEAGDIQKVFIPDLEKGDWQLALTVVLMDGRKSAPSIVPVNIPSDAAPSVVANIEVTLD